ncbi:MAG: hypothetical protein ACRCZ9_10330 [Fusobacteriaceae bacterium]
MKIIDLENEMEKIEAKARAEKVSILSLIYLDYILPLSPEGLAAKDVNATEEFIGEIFKKDHKITRGNSLMFYMMKSPSTCKEISKELRRYQIAIEED